MLIVRRTYGRIIRHYYSSFCGFIATELESWRNLFISFFSPHQLNFALRLIVMDEVDIFYVYYQVYKRTYPTRTNNNPRLRTDPNWLFTNHYQVRRRRRRKIFRQIFFEKFRKRSSGEQSVVKKENRTDEPNAVFKKEENNKRQRILTGHFAI